MSAEITSTVWGIAPWSDELLKVSGDIRRGRAQLEAYLGQARVDGRAYERLLAEAGITYKNDDHGQGTNLDYLRSTAILSEGFAENVEGAPVTRWFDTNTFYRQPVIDGPLHLPTQSWHFAPQFAKHRTKQPGYQPTWLSPYAFAKLSARSQGISEAHALRYVGELYEELLGVAAEEGLERVLLHEPYAPYHRVGAVERRKLTKTVGGLAANHPRVEVGMYFSYGNAAASLKEFAGVKELAALGCDLTKTPIHDLPPRLSGRFLAGIVDGANTLLEDDADIVGRAEAVAAVLDGPEISITHTVDLEHVPQPTAFEKIRQIGRVAATLKEVQQ